MSDPHIVTPGQSDEEPPTWDAYWAAVRAIDKHRERADRAEGALQQLRDHIGTHNDGCGEVDMWAVREILAGREVRH